MSQRRNRGKGRGKRLSTWEKVEKGMFLSMRELAEVTGFGENRVNQFKKRPGFPLFEGRTTLVKFQEWAFSHVTSAAGTSPGLPRAVHPPRPAGDKFCEPFR